MRRYDKKHLKKNFKKLIKTLHENHHAKRFMKKKKTYSNIIQTVQDYVPKCIKL